MRYRITFALLVLAYANTSAAADASLSQQLGLHGGAGIYQAACAACHGPNGHGTPQVSAGFEPPDSFPHFDKCEETTPEFTRDYTAVIRNGGPARGFSQIMPAFAAVLTPAEINEVVRYLRSFCKESGWPQGELNVPRALVTDKAFPESETILSTAVNAHGPAAVNNEIDYEHAFGKHDQVEVAVPFGWMHQPGAGLGAGLGDIVIGEKHVLYSRLNSTPGEPLYNSTGSILSIQGEVTLPTGNVRKGLAPYSLTRFESHGKDSRHGVHQDAQKSTYTTFLRYRLKSSAAASTSRTNSAESSRINTVVRKGVALLRGPGVI